MKGTLKKIRSKAVVAFLCALVVFANVIPVSALEHQCMSVERPGTRKKQSYVNINEDEHDVKYKYDLMCQTCHNSMGIGTIYVRESHSWGDYSDRGHVGENDHLYDLVCGNCSGTKGIRLITCDGKNTGYHATPW